MSFAPYVADEGDQCDACGRLMHEGDLFYQDDNLRVRWRFCTLECAHLGATEKSNKARFINFVLGEK